MDQGDLKKILDDRLQRETAQISRMTSSIFLLGGVCGIVLAYTSILQLCAGVLIGFAIQRGCPNGETIANTVLVWMSALLWRGMKIAQIYSHCAPNDDPSSNKND